MSEQKIKISLGDVKYIQAQIEKILHLSKGNQNGDSKPKTNASKSFMRESISSIQKSSRKYQGREHHRTASFDGLSSIRQERKSKSSKKVWGYQNVKEKSQDKISKKSGKSKSKKKGKKSTTENDEQSEKRTIDMFQDISKKPVKTPKDEPPPAIPIKNQNSLSASSLMRKWTMISQDQTSLNQTQINTKSALTRNQTQEFHPSFKFFENNSTFPTKKIEEKVAEPQKKEKSKKKTPYHLEKNNQVPLRSGQRYLSTKYAYKNLSQKQKREDVLRQKYSKLDQRLKKIREEVHQQKLENTLSEQDQCRKDKRMKTSHYLSEYYRYSPLKKLLNYSTKDKEEMQKEQKNQYQPLKSKKALKISMQRVIHHSPFKL